MKTLKNKILDAEVRCSQWLADGNQYAESGNKKKADLCYEKSQYWLDRKNIFQEMLFKNKVHEMEKVNPQDYEDDYIHDEPWSLARSLGFDDQEEFDDYCDEMERKNRPTEWD